MFSEGNAAIQSGGTKIAFWHTFFEFELAGSGVAARCRQLTLMAVWRTANSMKSAPNAAITICKRVVTSRPHFLAE
jgi:hypothetical protein